MVDFHSFKYKELFIYDLFFQSLKSTKKVKGLVKCREKV